jgi:hypothetical protein
VINGQYLCGGADATDVIRVTASGSGYQYGDHQTWQLRWKTTGLPGNKCYDIYISLGVAGATSAFDAPRSNHRVADGIDAAEALAVDASPLEKRRSSGPCT